MSLAPGRDIISITALELRSPALESDLWQRKSLQQPLLASLSIETDVDHEATTDSLTAGHSLNYGSVTKAIEVDIASLSPTDLSLEQLADRLAKVILFAAFAPNVRLQLSRPRALLSAESVGVKIYRTKADYTSQLESPSPANYHLSPSSPNPAGDRLFVRALRKSVIIGVNPCERVDEQEVILDLEFGPDVMITPYRGGLRAGWQGWRTVVKNVESHLASAHPLTIEAITTSLASLILTPPPPSPSPSPSAWNVTTTSVRLSKPSALMFARYPAVQVARSRSDFFLPSGAPRPFPLTLTRSLATTASSPAQDAPAASDEEVQNDAAAPPPRTAFLGIGTNVGERVRNISNALRELVSGGTAEEGGTTRVVDTSFLYESDAMYVTDQARFLNAVVKVETTLDPQALLARLKAIEDTLGRKKTIRNGPRVIDLDILLYEDVVFESGAGVPADRWLRIPHASIAEREFVLRPLADLAPSLLHPTLHATPLTLLATLLHSTPSSLNRVLPLSPSLTHPLGSHTLLMSILNTTPDSFSDGGDSFSLPSALLTAHSHLLLGADILDIGGMSTRPGAADVSIEQETHRVVPLIRALRAAGVEAPISIDTFRPEVARAAIEAGATIVNDVLGGKEEGMRELMAELDVPVVLMHSRGTPRTMAGLTDYPDGDVVRGVRDELGETVRKALEAGVRRWNIILDPGIGFAKTGKDNVVLLRHLHEALGRFPEGQGEEEGFLGQFPSLVGLSRKNFLGTLTGRGEAKERVWATAAGVTASVAGGTEVVRVHDVEMARDVIKVADAIYRAW